MLERVGADGHRGAYGFRLKAPQSDLPSLLALGADAQEVTITWSHEVAESDGLAVDDDSVVTSRAGAGAMRVLRDPAEIHLAIPEDLTPESIVHPMSTTPLSILARWLGHATLHAGAVLIDGTAFAFCGDREAGKSSMLAELTADGTPLVADDLLVVEDGHVLAGPHCLDLRPGAAERYGAASIGVVGLRERFRLIREPSPPRVRFGGIFALEWDEGDRSRVEPLGMAARLAILHGSDYSSIFGPYRPQAYMDLFDLPMWGVRRRRTWDGVHEAAELIRETARASLRGEPGHLQAGEGPPVRDLAGPDRA